MHRLYLVAALLAAGLSYLGLKAIVPDWLAAALAIWAASFAVLLWLLRKSITTGSKTKPGPYRKGEERQSTADTANGEAANQIDDRPSAGSKPARIPDR